MFEKCLDALLKVLAIESRSQYSEWLYQSQAIYIVVISFFLVSLFSIVTVLHSFFLLLAIVLLFKSFIVLLSLNVFDYLDRKFWHNCIYNLMMVHVASKRSSLILTFIESRMISIILHSPTPYRGWRTSRIWGSVSVEFLRGKLTNTTGI